jgi:PAS domain S-box-containing protein
MHFSSGRIFILFAPVLALGTLAALLALLAGLSGWVPHVMMPVAGGVGIAAALLGLGLAYRVRVQSRASDEALHNIEAQVGGILDSAMDGIITVNEEQRVVQYNVAAEKMFLRPRTAVVGQSLNMLLPERFHQNHRKDIEQFGRTGVTSRRMGLQTVVMGLRANGEEFPVEASISQIMQGGKKFFTGRLPPGNSPVSAKVSAMLAMLDATVAATRRISSDLRPLLLDDLGLVPAVEWLVQNFTERSGVACELALGSGSFDLEEPYASAVFRIVQESLTNVARHAGATQVEVTFERGDRNISIRVRDNGRGFSASDPRKPKTFGLMGLRERAGLLRGEARIESEPGRGTTIEVSIPVEDEVPPP